jgi:hypothetical protein
MHKSELQDNLAMNLTIQTERTLAFSKSLFYRGQGFSAGLGSQRGQCAAEWASGLRWHLWSLPPFFVPSHLVYCQPSACLAILQGRHALLLHSDFWWLAFADSSSLFCEMGCRTEVPWKSQRAFGVWLLDSMTLAKPDSLKALFWLLWSLSLSWFKFPC